MIENLRRVGALTAARVPSIMAFAFLVELSIRSRHSDVILCITSFRMALLLRFRLRGFHLAESAAHSGATVPAIGFARLLDKVDTCFGAKPRSQPSACIQKHISCRTALEFTELHRPLFCRHEATVRTGVRECVSLIPRNTDLINCV